MTFLSKMGEQEERIYKLFDKNKKKIVRTVIFSVFVLLFSQVPYVNLFLSKWIVFYLIAVFVFINFSVSKKKIIIICLLLIVFSLLLVLAEEHESAEIIGNYVYGLILVVMFIDLFKKY